MAGVRKALIVATDTYSDSRLTSLKAPATDAAALAEVLRDDTVGCFEVQTVLNRPSHEVELAIAEFFAAGRYGDTLLAHFSCHGVKSPTGELYFATSDTDLSDTFRLKVTGIPSALVRDAMEESRASLILCLVDCCYSGAFVKLTKAADTLDLTERLGNASRWREGRADQQRSRPAPASPAHQRPERAEEAVPTGTASSCCFVLWS